MGLTGYKNAGKVLNLKRVGHEWHIILKFAV